MGNKQLKPKAENGKNDYVSNIINWIYIVKLGDFRLQFVIGRGGFGKVYRAILKKNNKVYALKQLKKVKIIDKNNVKNIKNERFLLEKLHQPILVNMRYAFQDKDFLYLTLDYKEGGDLRYQICLNKIFCIKEISKS